MDFQPVIDLLVSQKIPAIAAFFLVVGVTMIRFALQMWGAQKKREKLARGIDYVQIGNLKTVVFKGAGVSIEEGETGDVAIYFEKTHRAVKVLTNGPAQTFKNAERIIIEKQGG